MNTCRLRLAQAALLCAAGLLSACGGSSDAAAPALMLTATIAPDAQGCPTGGQSFGYGVDTDRDGTLSDAEFQSGAVVCNGVGGQLQTVQATLPAGDPRCDSGNCSVLRIDTGDGSQPKELFVCFGCREAQGSADASRRTRRCGKSRTYTGVRMPSP